MALLLALTHTHCTTVRNTDQERLFPLPPCADDDVAAAVRRGEKFDRSRHECGTEVKAITFSAMQIRQQPGDAEVFVIVDI
jgi:SHS2 domain-containing protein